MRGHRIRALIALAVVVCAGLAACGDDGSSAVDTASPSGTDETTTTVSDETTTTEAEAEADETTTTEATEPAADPVVAVADSPLGEILVDANGTTLYVFMNDTDGTSTCTADCASAWPALEAPAGLAGGDGVDASLLGTTTRDDGVDQVTYGGSPLYTFSGDAAPGDTNGQGVGDVWFVVGPDGEAVQDPAAPADSGGTTDY